MNKVIRNNMVAVLISPGYGAGWYTWNPEFEDCIYDPDIVQMVLGNASPEDIALKAEEKWGVDHDQYFCTLGADTLQVEWVPVGSKFMIHEYDGSETLEIEPYYLQA